MIWILAFSSTMLNSNTAKRAVVKDSEGEKPMTFEMHIFKRPELRNGITVSYPK